MPGGLTLKNPKLMTVVACLNRYLQSQVGQAKQDVWSDLNGEVGGVMMRRLVSRTAQLAAAGRRQSTLAPQMPRAPVNHAASPVVVPVQG